MDDMVIKNSIDLVLQFSTQDTNPDPEIMIPKS
jgi:hypothetical protein